MRYLSDVSTNRIILIVVSCVLVGVAIVAISLFTIFSEVAETTNEIIELNKSLDSALEETRRFQDSMANDPFLKSLDSNSFKFDTTTIDTENAIILSGDKYQSNILISPNSK